MRKRMKVLIVGSVLLVAIFASLIMVPFYYADELYPLMYRDYIKKYSEEYRLDPNFVAGVIFSESRFNSRATSPVGARGLMQIMPGTAQGIALRLGDLGFRADNLYDPETSIKYGCWYLRDRFNVYKSEDFVLMAYNGGGGAVDRYRAGNGLPAETKKYVVIVKEARDMYDEIYGEWWKTVDFEKPKQRSFVSSLSNIGEFWKVLISTAAGLK